jgi:2'-hydroxyisoflavone reductase
MRLLVLGGTRFLGRCIVDEAVSRGYDVSTFSRGRSGHPRPGAEALLGDRTNPADLRQLAHREWDAVIDTSVLAPAHVAASARLLAGQVGHYTYISTISVYAGYPAEPVTEESPLLEVPADVTQSTDELDYGRLKVGSERAVGEAMPGRCLIARPGLIVGPHEDVGRLPWWLVRFAAGGAVLAPGTPDRPVRFTDARDLAAWLVAGARRRIPGVVNVPGAEGTTLGDLLTACAQVTGAGGRPRWTGEDLIAEAGVQPWTELPMWVPDTPEYTGIWRVSGDRAVRTGMRYRPLADTVHDTWLWLQQEAAATGRPLADVARRPGIGLDPVREQEILARLR